MPLPSYSKERSIRVACGGREQTQLDLAAGEDISRFKIYLELKDPQARGRRWCDEEALVPTLPRFEHL